MVRVNEIRFNLKTERIYWMHVQESQIEWAWSVFPESPTNCSIQSVFVPVIVNPGCFNRNNKQFWLRASGDRAALVLGVGTCVRFQAYQPTN